MTFDATYLIKTVETSCRIKAMRHSVIGVIAFMALVFCVAVGKGVGQQPPRSDIPVQLDGHTVLTIHTGNLEQTAEERAEGIRSRLREWAERSGVNENPRVIVTPDGADLIAGNVIIASVYPEDAGAEKKTIPALAEEWRGSMQGAVREYRLTRTPQKRILRGLLALLVIGLTVFVIFMLRRLRLHAIRRAVTFVARKAPRGDSVVVRRTNDLARVFTARMIALLWLLGYVVVVYIAFHTLLYLFPLTRPASYEMLRAILAPIQSFGQSVWRQLPSIVFVIIVGIGAWYGLKASGFYFEQIEAGTITVQGFKRSWASTTQRLVSVGIILLAILIAYPYIPGSQSAAFKGVSLFIGILVSLGSSGSVANVIGGVMLTYTGAFELGDLVKVGETLGKVETMGTLTTRIRTRKNELVSIPNSVVISTQIVNYSIAGRGEGLVISAQAGIGYDTPWRQVEAMMLLAAGRTAGVRKQPEPIVLQISLNSFDVTYEVNTYIEAGQLPYIVLAELHKNILDVFNEYGVQIMTPSYRGDPADLKIVPRNKWYTEPARSNEEAPPTSTTSS